MKHRTIVAVIVNQRSETSINVQKILSAWGCMITTRLGLHEGVLDTCTQTGLIIVEMVGEEEKKEEFVRKLNLIKGVQAKKIDLQVD